MLVTDADLIAIHRANETGSRDAAMAELRRRWLGINDVTAPAVLDRVLSMALSMPPTLKPGCAGAYHDGSLPPWASRRRR
jgi:hypothetical protein